MRKRKHRQFSTDQPPRGRCANSMGAWNFYLAQIGLGVDRGKGKTKSPATKTHPLSPWARRVLEIAEQRGCTIPNAIRIADRERTAQTANAG